MVKSYWSELDIMCRPTREWIYCTWILFIYLGADSILVQTLPTSGYKCFVLLDAGSQYTDICVLVDTKQNTGQIAGYSRLTYLLIM